jgi:superfamily II DNA or RNA helicase
MSTEPFSPTHLRLSLMSWLAGFLGRDVERGRILYRRSAVGGLSFENGERPVAQATVFGERAHSCTLLFAPKTGWEGACSCDAGQRCQHLAAVAHALVDIFAGRRPVPLAPTVPAPTLERSIDALPAAPNIGFRQQLEPVLAEKLGRSLLAEERRLLDNLAAAFLKLQHAGRLDPAELRRLIFDGQSSALHASGGLERASSNWWQTPPSDPLELWQFIAYDLEAAGRPIPEFMQAVTDTAKVHEVLAQRARRDVVQRWERRFENLLATPPAELGSGTPPTARPRPLELRLCLASDKWHLETREGPDAPWRSARAWFDQIVRESSGLADIETSPAVYAFIAICQEQVRRSYDVSLSPASPGGPALLHRLLLHPLARALVTGPSGAPLVYAPEPLTWLIERSSDDPKDYVMRLRLPTGDRLPPSALFLPGRPEMYLHQGVIYRGPPALDGQSAASAVVPAEVVERPPVLRALRRLGAQLPAEIESRFTTLPLRPRIECRLMQHPQGHECVELELLGVSDHPPIRQRWTATGWSLHDDDRSSADAQQPILTFETAAVEAVAARLPDGKFDYDLTRQRWTRRVTKTFAEEFVAWRESLPAHAEVVATGELASLLGGPVRARVDFELLESKAHRDWFDLALALRPEDSALTSNEIALLLKARGRLVRLPGKGWQRISIEIDAEARAMLESAGFEANSIAEAALAGDRQRFHVLQLTNSGVVEHLSQQQAAALNARARTLTSPPPPPIPDGLRAELRPYQKDGYEFLTFLSANGLGGVLADDMGLGKTLQTLAWLLWLASRQPPGAPLRALVVCPKSVVGNWQMETARFAPSLGVIRFAAPLGAHDLPTRDDQPTILVANYTQLRLQADYFQSQRWHAVVLDEGQFIKNPAAKVAQVARELPGEHRLVLTGTPIENRLLDLWSLFSFALPGLLGSQASFKRLYPDDDPLALSRLRSRVRHFLLRRTKTQVASDLPPRIEEDILVELEGDQARLYQLELKRARAQLLGIETARQFDQVRLNILASLLRLRQICCHPGLVDSTLVHAPAAKLDALLEHVEELRDEGYQVLVFSQFVTMLELIAARLRSVGIEHLMLTGQTENRDELVAQFQSDQTRTVFLLSLKAAGFGLNLTAASYVILYDPWWNPAVEAQAIDRTHRIGQTVPVNAYRFIARGTVEEKIRALQREKAALAAAVVQEEAIATVMDLESLREILS